MTNKGTNDLESSLLVIKLDDTPWKASKSPSQKRRIPSSVASGTSAKQRRICDQKSYQSPLVHLGKTSCRTELTSIDDSVIVLEELTRSPASDKPALSISEKKLPASTDDSIIILSDNEEESNVEKNLGVILEDDSSGGCPEFMKITPARKITRKKTVRYRYPFPLCCKADEEAKSTTDKGQLRKKKRKKTRWSDANTVQPQSISIDSEDENTKPSSSQPLATSGDVANNERPVIAESVSAAGLMKQKAKKKRFSPFWKDTKGTSSSNGPNITTIIPIAEQYGKRQDARLLALENWRRLKRAGAVKNIFTKVLPVKKLSEPMNKPSDPINKPSNPINKPSNPINRPSNAINKPEVNGIRNYYTEEIIVKAPGSLREIVIDGCNVAMAYTNGNSFSETGLKLVIDYFILRGHTVKVFVPQHVRSWQHKLLEKLYTEGIIVFTPSRRVGNKKIIPYDDRYILDYAMLCAGIVVSQDQYRDLYAEKYEWQEIIEQRLLVPTFVGKCLMFPEDPLGRGGPSLEAFLRH